MLIRNVSREDLEKALISVNVMYSDNVEWNNFQHEGPSRGGGSNYRVTLKVKDSRGPGARYGFVRTASGNRRRTTSACWHVHGFFFDALLSVNPNAVIMSRQKRIDRYGGNWEDANIGSGFDPLLFSDACDCYDRGIA